MLARPERRLPSRDAPYPSSNLSRSAITTCAAPNSEKRLLQDILDGVGRQMRPKSGSQPAGVALEERPQCQIISTSNGG
ncbi:MAG: hypothetical protein M9890_11245 [Thermomicrobiales bacterium]|nr:hypothetical protein [Thermomicrobiales bacterium]